MEPERGEANEEALIDHALAPLLSVTPTQPAPVQRSSTVASPAPTTPVLIASKLSIPYPVRQTVRRPRLEKILQAGRTTH